MPYRDRFLLLGLMLCAGVFYFGIIEINMLDHTMRDLPLSEFRFGKWATYGRMLFLILLVIGGIYLAITFRFGNKWNQCVAIISQLLLIITTLTPTFNVVHEFAANALLVLLFFYFAGRLYIVSSLWIAAHLAAPVVIIFELMSYSLANFGMIQKSLICYLVLIVCLDCLLLTELFLYFSIRRKEQSKEKQIKHRIRMPRVIYRRYS